MKTDKIVRASVIAALYCVLTVVLAPISFGPIQVRVSEVLCILPIYFSEAVPGLFAGCLLSNTFSGSIFDIVLGSLATLLGAVLTRKFRSKPYIASVFPVLTNGVIVGAYMFKLTGVPFSFAYYAVSFLWIALGEIISCVVLGGGLITAINKNKLFK